jgi:predicted RNA-binding Zn ribbon-like protein
MERADPDGSLEWAGAAAAAVTEWPCVDLVNSLYWRLSDRVEVLRDDEDVVRVADQRVLLRRQARTEFLRNYGDVVRWARREGLLADAEARHLLAEVARRPREAAAAHERAIALREALYAVFSAVARRAPPPAAALHTLNAELAGAMVPARLVPAGAGFRREWLDPRDELGWMLGPVVRSAAELLTSPARERLKECPGGAGTACGEIFVDQTRNRSRRWCSGATCGNRVRLYRHYTRVRSGDP